MAPTVKARAGLAAAAALAAVLAPATSAHAQPPFQIKNYGSGLCIQPPASGSGMQLVQKRCDSSNPLQKWNTNGTGGNYQFVNLDPNGGFCLNAHGSDKDRTPVDLWPCNGISNERWQFSPSIPNGVPAPIHSKVSGGNRCLDVAAGSGSENALIQIYHCTSDNSAQVWLLGTFDN